VLRESISEHVLEEIALGLKAYLNTLEKEFLSDTEEAREEVRLWVRRWIKREIGARPMILPAVIEI